MCRQINIGEKHGLKMNFDYDTIKIMKTSELMRGDWVHVKNSEYLNNVQIDGILGHSIFTKEAEYESEEISIEDIEPIPITVKLLEKNGFKKWTWDKRVGYVTTYAIGDGFQIEVCKNGFELVDNCSDGGDCGYTSDWLTDVGYVHKLQHLLKEFEIDKEIIL